MSFSKKKEEESKAKKKDNSFSKKAIDASKVLVGTLAVKAVDEISKIVVDYPKKPKDVSRREFSKTKPTKSFTKAARTVKFWENNPEFIPQSEEKRGESGEYKQKRRFFDPDYSQQKNVQKYSVVPGLDGLVSFSILLAPFAILLGIINQLFKDNLFIDILLWFLLFIYILFIALPGAYLGLDAIRDGTKALLVNSGATIKFGLKGIYYFFKIFFQGIYELFVLFFASFFENAFDYWVFITSYVVSFIILFLVADTIFVGGIAPFTLFVLVIIPALLPASVLHRYWMLFRFNRRTR
ncbi:MAG: hypothetical protein ACW981_09900 [Candidatus Hodarchaeales archaeon]|jgi:hypothetical protein